MKIIIEPTGCLGISAALFSDIDIRGKRVGIIISGGNVDLGELSKFFTKDVKINLKMKDKDLYRGNVKKEIERE